MTKTIDALQPEMLEEIISTFKGASTIQLDFVRVELPRYQWAQIAAALAQARAEQAAAPVAKLEPLTDAEAIKLAQQVIADSYRPIGGVALGLLAIRATEAAHNAKLGGAG